MLNLFFFNQVPSVLAAVIKNSGAAYIKKKAAQRLLFFDGLGIIQPHI